MKITLDIPNNKVLCAFLNGVRVADDGGLEVFNFQIAGEEFENGSTVKLPRKEAGDVDFDYEAED